jgi:hypothetical protein
MRTKKAETLSLSIIILVSSAIELITELSTRGIPWTLFLFHKERH